MSEIRDNFIKTLDDSACGIGEFVEFNPMCSSKKISIPTPQKVSGNSEGVGGLKSQNFLRKVWGLTGISKGVGGFKPKTFRVRHMDIFWDNPIDIFANFCKTFLFY